MGAPYGTNRLALFNRHLPCGLSTRFVQDWVSGQSCFIICQPGSYPTPYSRTYWWREEAESEDLLSYRVDKTKNCLILEEWFETDSIGQPTVYHNTTPVKQNHVYYRTSCDTVSNKIIYKQEEILPEDIDNWDSLEITHISSNIRSIKDILISKRRLNMRLIVLIILLVQSILLFKKTK